jgi:hypothetical protein
MATIVVPFKDLGKTLTKLGEKANAALDAGLLSAAMRAQSVVVTATTQKKKVNTGFYRLAWKAERVSGASAVRVYNQAPYAGVIEYGRRPGARMPPVEPLARWAQRKLALPYPQARSIGFAIARSIQKKGIPASNVLGGAIPKLEKAFVQEVKRELDRALGTP